jgi:uncharacterized membrane protein
MSRLYNQIAGGSLNRMSGLSDGVFGFAMTVLVLDLREPIKALFPGGGATFVSEGAFLSALHNFGGPFATFLTAFMTLGIFWVGQQTQMESFKHADRNLTWIYIAFLSAVSLIPFTTWMLVNNHTLRSALLVYWFNILMLGLILLAGIQYARHVDLFKEEAKGDYKALLNRIVYAQSLYAICAALCFINVPLSIGCILTVQLIYAIAPGVKLLYRL